MYQKLKSFILDDALFGAMVVILVGIGSFGLGRLSAQENTPSVNSLQSASSITALHRSEDVTPSNALSVTPDTPVTASAELNATQAGGVVASRSGTKYHLPTCAGAKQIKPENRIEFSSVAAARAAGYTPAANCPGLQ